MFQLVFKISSERITPFMAGSIPALSAIFLFTKGMSNG